MEKDDDLLWPLGNVVQVEWDTEEYLLIEQLHKDPDAAAQCLALRALTSYPRKIDTAISTAAGAGAMKQSLASLAIRYVCPVFSWTSAIVAANNKLTYDISVYLMFFIL